MPDGPAGGPRPLADSNLVVIFSFWEPVEREDAVRISTLAKEIVTDGSSRLSFSVNDTGKRVAMTVDDEMRKERIDRMEEKIEQSIGKELMAIELRTS